MRQLMTRSWTRLGAAVLLLGLLATLGLPAGASAPRVLDPIGGGYSTTTENAFVQTVIDHATGSTVRILIVPSAYAHTSLGYAQQHVDSLQAKCVSLLGNSSTFTGGCDTELVPLWTRDDAQDPSIAAMIAAPETDGIFILGGDQDAAMEILAGTPAEDAMAADYQRGVIVSGTSAGTAVESRTMLADYANGGGPSTALQQDKVDIWWDDDGDLLRGLSFGSTNTILDQHFYQRGRFGRSLNVAAQSVDHYGGNGRLGVGVDYATSVHLTNDTVLDDVTGDSSVALIDFSQASFDWLGPQQTLSARDVLTQIMPPGPYAYDAAARQLSINGVVQPASLPAAWDAGLLQAPGPGTLMLGGDLLAGGSGLADFVSQARATGSHTIVLVAAGFFSTGDASSTANAYASALKKLGWSTKGDQIVILNFEDASGWSRVAPGVVAGAAGVILVGGDQSQMARPLADATFRNLVQRAIDTAPLVLTDRAMTPVMGDYYLANADPTDQNLESQSIAAFSSDYADVQPGLGYVHAAFEPRLTEDQRWGRLYGLAQAEPQTIVFGISEETALSLSGNMATVAGERSVVALDGRAAQFATGDNGAIAAFNVWLNLYAPGETVTGP
ncbi:MAG TPA: Type 1 glutamine amidotransferase-like domain-containing protein [Thermomicrobiaceae bacterium]|nr:Type 1 glutamine amidotransferase-like domain-containing protein [Thermomicrobiaceae bacterium]